MIIQITKKYKFTIIEVSTIALAKYLSEYAYNFNYISFYKNITII